MFRIGYQTTEDELDPTQVQGLSVGEFLLTNIQPSRSRSHDPNAELVPDLVIPCDDWLTKVAIDLSYHPNHFDLQTAKHFDKLFRHALYLSTPIIIVSCPDSDLAYVSMASTISECLNGSRSSTLVLFKVPMDKSDRKHDQKSWLYDSEGFPELNKGQATYQNGCKQSNGVHHDDSLDTAIEYGYESGYGNSASASQESGRACPRHWQRWNSFRTHLGAEPRIAACLWINNDLIDDEEELNKWTGEPVLMVIISIDQFVRSPGRNGFLRLTHKCSNFIENIARANSFRTSFVVESRKKRDMKEYAQCLHNMVQDFSRRHEDPLRSWNDKIQPPLQPLSTNLEASVYGVFEMDATKYIKYRDAMISALRYFLISEGSPVDRTIILMVLGAGRGPLVDSFINAIRAINSKCKFKLYALDKNPSAVISLRYKQKNDWSQASDICETEVVEADMREWEPNVKADIIATELLGSLSDNELSPECIDGAWRFSTPKTLSIPRSYCSYIGPICSYKMHQELSRLKDTQQSVFDQIYVSKLTNCYNIDTPQKLFEFEHSDLSQPPSARCNERYTKLTFWSKVETVCHGFAGYFTSTLFDEVKISTLLNHETPNMPSWFPAFIPLEYPIQLSRDAKIEIHFWRKESTSSVWYEWVVTQPQRSRIYTQNGSSAVMSKYI